MGYKETVMSEEQIEELPNMKRLLERENKAKVALESNCLPELVQILKDNAKRHGDCCHSASIVAKQVKEAQAEITWEALLNKITEWGKGDCPHDIQELSQSGLCEYTKDMPEKKRECPLCWQAFLKERRTCSLFCDRQCRAIEGYGGQHKYCSLGFKTEMKSNILMPPLAPCPKPMTYPEYLEAWENEQFNELHRG